MNMRKIAIIHDPSSSHARTWVSWLQSDGFCVDTIYDEDSFKCSRTNNYDLVIPLITISDYVNKDNARIRALTYFGSKSYKLLTPADAIAFSSDKLVTASVLQNNSLPHPQTSLAENFNWRRRQFTPVIVKPRFGHSGNGVYLVRSEEEFKKYQDVDILVQRFIEHAECIRVIASPSGTLCAYKKIPPKGEIIANIDAGAVRAPLVLTDEMRQLAESTVRALGGGLMGVDLLNSPEGLFVLEANVPFGFDTKDSDFRRKLIDYIKKESQ